MQFFYLWQDKNFPKTVFRCKNDSISGKMPIFAHELDITIEKTHVLRLKNAVLDYENPWFRL